MAGKSTALANAILDHILGKTTYTAPATLYFALMLANPTDAGGGTEVSGGSYARVPVVNNVTNFPNAADGSKVNGTDIDFPVATGAWGAVAGVAIYDASTAGNLVMWAVLTAGFTVPNGGEVKFSPGQLTFNED